MNTNRGLPGALTRNLPTIETALQAFTGAVDSELDAVARYALGWEDEAGRPLDPAAKRIRPALCLFASECAGAPPTDALPGAIAIELVHNFSLVHDDIQDRDDERHGRPTLWRRLGEAQAINAGDYLFTLAWRALTTASEVDPDLRIRAMDVLADAATRMIRGQWQDLWFETHAVPDAEDYFAMVDGKTGALLGASLEMGAILAGADALTCRAMRDWGISLGRAFQAYDDILGIWGEPSITGKSATSDVTRKKRSLPIVLGMADPSVRAIVEHEFARDPDVDAVVHALEASGARDRAHQIAQFHASSTSELTRGMPVAAHHQAELAEIAAYVVNRAR